VFPEIESCLRNVWLILQETENERTLRAIYIHTSLYIYIYKVSSEKEEETLKKMREQNDE
jgi:hypothetical protein